MGPAMDAGSRGVETMDWKKLITALSAVASALSGAEAMLHAVGLPTEVAAGASLVFLVLTAVGRSVWPERKPAGGNGPLLALCLALGLTGCGATCRLASKGIEAAAIAGSSPDCDETCKERAIKAVDGFEWLGEKACEAP